MNLKYFLQKKWIPIFITSFIIILYLIFHFIVVNFLERELTTLIFILILILVLFPLREFLTSFTLLDFNWDYLMDSEFHHFEFLAKFFTLENLIYRITPELMVWLKINECRLFILNSDKKNYIMYLYNRGKIENIHIIPKKKIFYLTKTIKKYHNIITRNDPFLLEEEKKMLEKFNTYIVVPFYHLSRLMGFISFHNPTENRFAIRALELYATKAAFLIHDEILKKRIQNITKFEEEIKISEKIRNMLQSYTPPNVPNYNIQIPKIQSASIIEFANFNQVYYGIILSIPKVNGISGMILSGKLGYIFAYFQHHKNSFKISKFLEFLKTHKEFTIENYPVEILILEFDPEKNYVILYCENPEHYNIKYKNKIVKFSYYYRLYVQPDENYSVFYKEFLLMNFSYQGIKYATIH